MRPLRNRGYRLAKRAAFAALSLGLVLAFYRFGKTHPLATPRLLPLTPIDRVVPFVPSSVWIYGSIPPALLFGWLAVPNRAHGKRLLLALLAAAAACACTFVLFPTIYPRDAWPLASTGTAAARALLALRRVDDATNCFPSLHVALATCLALSADSSAGVGAARSGSTSLSVRAVGILPYAWAALLALSTLTTKQHYVVDVLGGIVVGLVATSLARGRRAGIFAQAVPPLDVATPDGRRAVARLAARAAELEGGVQIGERPARGAGGHTAHLSRFLNQVIYVEEIAGHNFAFLARASADPSLAALYTRFAEDERRHAEALRELARAHAMPLEPPGLGVGLLLDQFDVLAPTSPADALLVALAIPLFETFLDAGTIPFVRDHPAIASPDLDALVRSIERDEALHLALNWRVGREAAVAVKARRGPRRWLSQLAYVLNPAVLYGAMATPFLAVDVYARAYLVGFDFRALLPAFGRLRRLRVRYPELHGFFPFYVLRAFTALASAATHVVIALDHLSPTALRAAARLLLSVTDFAASLAFGPDLLARRALPAVPPPEEKQLSWS